MLVVFDHSNPSFSGSLLIDKDREKELTNSVVKNLESLIDKEDVSSFSKKSRIFEVVLQDCNNIQEIVFMSDLMSSFLALETKNE